MASKVDICNYALANIRAQSINSIDEASINAQYCKLKYDLVLDFMLRDTLWNFARKQQALALVTDDLFDWVYAYQYPSDCLKVNRLMSIAEKISAAEEGFVFRPEYYKQDFLRQKPIVPFAVLNVGSNRVIGANSDQLWIDYQIKVEDPNLYDSHFTMALVWYLTAEIALPVIGGDQGRAERKAALQMYQVSMDTAIASNADERDNGDPLESDFINIRS